MRRKDQFCGKCHGVIHGGGDNCGVTVLNTGGRTRKKQLFTLNGKATKEQMKLTRRIDRKLRFSYDGDNYENNGKGLVYGNYTLMNQQAFLCRQRKPLIR